MWPVDFYFICTNVSCDGVLPSSAVDGGNLVIGLAKTEYV